MRKSIIVVALLALPALSACGNDQQSATPATTTANAVTPTSAAAPTSGSGAPATSPGASSPGATSPGATTRPGGALTAEQISKALQDKGKLSPQTADCVAAIYLQEGLSDSGIQKIIDSANGTNPAKISLGAEDLIKVGKATERIATECVK